MRQTESRKYRKFVEADSSFELWRLQDEEYRVLRYYSFPIRWDGLVLMELQSIDERAGQKLLLPKVLVALEADYGPCSTDIDREKQTFAFPFLIRFTKNERSWFYLLKIADVRGCLEFSFWRVVDDHQYMALRRDIYHPSIEDELGMLDRKYWIAYLWGVLHSGSAIWCRYKIGMNELSPFFRQIDSNHIVYGFVDGKFFEYRIDDVDEYQTHVARLQQQYGLQEVTLEDEIAATQALVRAIAQS
jgi:hypothetical protein